MNRILSSIIGLMILSGCTTIRFQTLDVKNAAGLKDQTVAVTNYPKPDFSAMTPAKATLGLLGAFAAISDGNQIVSTNNVADPAKKTSDELVTVLEGKLGAKRVAIPIEVNDDDVAKISTLAAPTARYVLDVKTFVWNMGYFATDWFHYRVMYTARARLIDTNAKAVIAEGFCKRIPESNANAPTYDEAVANQAKWLKEQMNQVGITCADNLKHEMLALSTPASTAEKVATNAESSAGASSNVMPKQPESVTPANASNASSTPVPSQMPPPAVITPQAPSQPTPMPPATEPALIKRSTPTSPASAPIAATAPEAAKTSNTYQPTVREVVQASPEKSNIQLVEFVLGVSSATVERLAKSQSCVGGSGAGLVSPKGSRELYKMKCEDGKTLMAKCELRQCAILSHR